MWWINQARRILISISTVHMKNLKLSSYLFQFINAWKSEQYIIFLSFILLQIFERQVHNLIFKYKNFCKFRKLWLRVGAMVVVGGRGGGPSLNLTLALPNQMHAQMHVRTASYSTESLWKYRAFVSLLNKPLYSKLCKLLGVPHRHKDRDISPTVTGPRSGDTNWYLGQWLMRSEVRVDLFTWLELLPTKLLALVISASK